ncbi:MAG: hypothetical protein QXP60_05555 [Nitrososphaerota archaeon]
MINIKLTQELKIKYSESIFGSMFVTNVPNIKKHEVDDKIIIAHLNDISSNLRMVFDYVASKIQIHK